MEVKDIAGLPFGFQLPVLILQSPIAAWIPDPWFVNWFSSFENFRDPFIAGVLAFIMMYFGKSSFHLLC